MNAFDSFIFCSALIRFFSKSFYILIVIKIIENRLIYYKTGNSLANSISTMRFSAWNLVYIHKYVALLPMIHYYLNEVRTKISIAETMHTHKCTNQWPFISSITSIINQRWNTHRIGYINAPNVWNGKMRLETKTSARESTHRNWEIFHISVNWTEKKTVWLYEVCGSNITRQLAEKINAWKWKKMSMSVLLFICKAICEEEKRATQKRTKTHTQTRITFSIEKDSKREWEG